MIHIVVGDFTIHLFFVATARKIQHFLVVTGMHVITRVMGILLSALTVQFMIDDILQSGLFGS